MEINEAGKIVIARPVASRPAFSGFRSFTELLCTTSSPNALSKTAVAAIKPRTVRFKPAGNQNLVEMDSFEVIIFLSQVFQLVVYMCFSYCFNT